MGYTFRPEGGGEEMPWKESSVMDERMRFVIRLRDGETMAALCREFGISRKTGYKIFERYEQCGVEGLSDRTRRPFRYANQLPAQVEAAIVSAKREKPHWGARKIRERLLRRLPHAIKVPAASTIHAVLDRHGLVQPMGPRRNRAQGTPLSQGLLPNDLWCTDYKGEFQLSDRRYCYPLTVTDYSSRFLLLCEALESNREELAFPAFERLFQERGLPRAIRSDNGVPFASPHGLFQLSKLSVWWLRLGISIERIRPGHEVPGRDLLGFLPRISRNPRTPLPVPRPYGCGHQLRTGLPVQQENQPQRIPCRTSRRRQRSRPRYLVSQFYGLRSRLYRFGGKNLAAPREPLRAKSVTYVSGTFCYLCLRNGQLKGWSRRTDLNR